MGETKETARDMVGKQNGSVHIGIVTNSPDVTIYLERYTCIVDILPAYGLGSSGISPKRDRVFGIDGVSITGPIFYKAI